MKKLSILTISLWILLVGASQASAVTCENFTADMTKNVISIFHDSTKSEDQKRKDLTEIFQEAVDTDWIGKFVLGTFWRGTTPDVQAEYLKTYNAYLAHTYISKFNDENAMNVDDIKVLALKPLDAGTFEAKTIIKQKGDDDVAVDYLLDQNSGKCQVHDIKIEGVSLLTSQRSEFSSLAGSSGVAGVIAAMKKRI